MRTIALGLSLVFIFMIPWEGIIELPGLGTAAKLVGFVLAAFWLLTVVFTNDVRKPTVFHILVCLFALWNGLSIFWSAEPDRAMANLVTWAQLVAMVFILWDLFTTQLAVLAGLQAYVLGAYVAVGSALSNYLTGSVYYDHYERFSPSAQTNPDLDTVKLDDEAQTRLVGEETARENFPEKRRGWRSDWRVDGGGDREVEARQDGGTGGSWRTFPGNCGSLAA